MTTEAPPKGKKKPVPKDPTIALATVADTVQAIYTVDIDSGTPTELAQRLELALRARATLNDIIDAITDNLASNMEEDTMTVAGVGVFTRKARTSSSWIDDGAKERMYDDAVREIVHKIAIDPMTGEVHPPLANAVRETWRIIGECFSLGADPKSAFRKSLGLQPDLYRTKYTTGYTVTIAEETI